MRSLIACVIACWVVLIGGGEAWANDPALADKLFREGQALLDAGKRAEACERFAASMAADPSGGTALNLGKCAKEEGKTASAWQHYQRAAQLLAAAGDTERTAFATQEVAALAPRVSFLTIEAPSIDGLVVRRNGKAVKVGERVAVDPGEQLVEASAPDRKPWSKKVSLTGEGQSETVTIPELEPLVDGAPVDPMPVAPPEAESRGMPGLMIGGIIVGAVGIVAVGVGAVLGGLVLSDASKARDDATLCPGDVCTPEGREVIDGAEGKALGSTILLAVGGAAVVGGLLMVLLAPSGEEASAQPVLGPGYAGVRVRF